MAIKDSLGGTCWNFRNNLIVLFTIVKVALSPFKKVNFICFNESPLKMMKKRYFAIFRYFDISLKSYISTLYESYLRHLYIYIYIYKAELV